MGERTHTIDDAEIAKFTAMADEWWNPQGKFQPLHKFNPVRLSYIRAQACALLDLDANSATPLDGLNLLDIGCGGGLLSEPMARLGAHVIGADASEETIKTAQIHATQSGLQIDYRATTPEALAATGMQFDIILNMEVIEHVAHPTDFIRSCGQMLKPDGIMFLATISRTPKSFALAIIGAEYVLGWLPRGTHDWHKFITPTELETIANGVGLDFVRSTGVSYNPLTAQWRTGGDMSVNYIAVAERSDSDSAR